MRMHSRAALVASRAVGILGSLAAAVLLAACTGSTGAQGGAGSTGASGPAGPAGPSSTVTAINVTTATQIKATITEVKISSKGQPIVDFTLVDQNGVPLSGLPASDVSFAIAKLVPPGVQLKAYPGLSAPTPLVQSQWQSYLYNMAEPAASSAGTTADPVVGITPEPEATTESGTSGTLVDNGNGSYEYTFDKDIETDPVVTYDSTLVHRVGLEIRGLAATNSPVYTFIPATGATSGFDADDAVDDAACTACHQQLAFHGGGRTEVKYCVVCHNPSSTDPSSGNTLDFKVMIHKIHMGVDLPTVQAGMNYYILGYRNSISDFSDIVYPQTDASDNNTTVSGTGQRFCTTCHTPDDTAAPQSGNYQTVINAASCGSCHDNVNFTTGLNHGPGNLPASDADCVTCHGPTSTFDSGALQVVAAHTTPVDSAAKKFQYKILSVTNTAPGNYPQVTLEVVDPTDGNAPYDIQDPSGPFQLSGSRLVVDMAWPTADFNNIGSGSATASDAGTPNQPVSIDFQSGAINEGGDVFSATSTVAVPSDATGSGAMMVEGRAVVSLANMSGTGTTNTELGITGVNETFAINDPSPVARREVVSIAKCDACHRVLTLHGQNRTDDIQLCTGCHNPNASDIGQHVASSGSSGYPLCAAEGTSGANAEQPIDFKVFIHEIHASGATDSSGNPRYPSGVTVCSFGARPTTFDVAYPGNLEDCDACHVNSSYYPVDDSKVQGTTVVSNDRTTLTDDVVISPNAAVCSSCHTSATAQQHMIQNGANFDATKTASGALVSVSSTGQPIVETCSICHGPGGIADVKVVHDLADFPD
jgi:OmcA/MtrC family decaheme c-type cytochrome